MLLVWCVKWPLYSKSIFQLVHKSEMGMNWGQHRLMIPCLSVTIGFGWLLRLSFGPNMSNLYIIKSLLIFLATYLCMHLFAFSHHLCSPQRKAISKEENPKVLVALN
jgi:hypothetical protein